MADDRGMALRGANDVLVAVVDHLHGPAARARQQGSMESDRAGEVLLAAEAAAHGRGTYPDLVIRQAEPVRQRLVDVVRTLHGTEDGERSVVLVPSDHPVALDVDVLLV